MFEVKGEIIQRKCSRNVRRDGLRDYAKRVEVKEGRASYLSSARWGGRAGAVSVVVKGGGG